MNYIKILNNLLKFIPWDKEKIKYNYSYNFSKSKTNEKLLIMLYFFRQTCICCRFISKSHDDIIVTVYIENVYDYNTILTIKFTNNYNDIIDLIKKIFIGYMNFIHKIVNNLTEMIEGLEIKKFSYLPIQLVDICINENPQFIVYMPNDKKIEEKYKYLIDINNQGII